MEFIISEQAKKTVRKAKEKANPIYRRILFLAVPSIGFAIVFIGLGIFMKQTAYIWNILWMFLGVRLLISSMHLLDIRKTSLNQHIYSYEKERLKIDQGFLGHFFKITDGPDAFLMVTPLDKIRDATYNEETKRLEYHADMFRLYHYADASSNTLKEEEDYKDELVVFYNYYEPSLVSVLEENGIKITKVTGMGR